MISTTVRPEEGSSQADMRNVGLNPYPLLSVDILPSISQAVWLYHRFTLSLRDVEDLLAERGVIVSYESIRKWCRKFGRGYARNLRRKQGRFGDAWFLDELFITIQGKRHYLWRAVDQDGDTIDILVQPRRDCRATKRFFRKLLKGQGWVPRRLVTDKLRSYSAACREVFPFRDPLHATIRKQPSRSLSPVDASTGAPDAAMQVKSADPTLSCRPCGGPQFVPLCSPSPAGCQASIPSRPRSRPRVRLLAGGDFCVLRDWYLLGVLWA